MLVLLYEFISEHCIAFWPRISVLLKSFQRYLYEYQIKYTSILSQINLNFHIKTTPVTSLSGCNGICLAFAPVYHVQ